MALTVEDVDSLQQYIIGVMNRADHHAGNVNEIALALVGAIVWKKDDTPIRVMARDGETKNVLWVSINSVRYAFSYNHQTNQIEMRGGSVQGDVLHHFDNSTPLTDIKEIFEALS